MKLDILLHPDPRLKKVCDPVDDLSDELRDLSDRMLKTMYDAPGIGLAAPQIGVPLRVFVYDVRDDEIEPGAIIKRLKQMGVNPAGIDVEYQDFNYDGRWNNHWTNFFDFSDELEVWKQDISPISQLELFHTTLTSIFISLN